MSEHLPSPDKLTYFRERQHQLEQNSFCENNSETSEQIEVETHHGLDCERPPKRKFVALCSQKSKWKLTLPRAVPGLGTCLTLVKLVLLFAANNRKM